MFNLVSYVWIIYVFIKNFIKRMAEKCTSTIKHHSMVIASNDLLLLSHNEFNKVVAAASDASVKTYDQQCSNNSINNTITTSDSSSSNNNNNNNNNNNDNNITINNPQSSSSSSSFAVVNNVNTFDTLPKKNKDGQAITGYFVEKECETENDNDNCNDNVDDNHNDDEDDEDYERIKKQEHQKGSHCCEKVKVYLETPVLDDNNELMLMMSTSTDIDDVNATINKHHISDISTKPKRLSDEFFSADDGEYDCVADDDNNSENHKENETEPTASLIINYGGKIHDNQDDDNHKFDKSLIKLNDENKKLCADIQEEEIITERLISNHSGYMDDEEMSTCSNLMDIDNVHDETSPPHSSISPTMVNLVDGTADEMTANDGDGNDIHEDDVNDVGDGDYHNGDMDNIFYNSNTDVQSMDAIERKDFINEQKITGGVILKGSSLISGDNRLNLGLLNIFSQKLVRNESLSRHCVNDDNNQIIETPLQQLNDSDKLSTTPTSSRSKSSSLHYRSIGTNGTKSATKLNLTESLEKYSEHFAGNNETKIVNNISNRLGTDSPLGESSTVLISNCSNNNNTEKLKSQQFHEAFMNCNSSDSLQSDKSCRMDSFTVATDTVTKTINSTTNTTGNSSSNFEFSTNTLADIKNSDKKIPKRCPLGNVECGSSNNCCNKNAVASDSSLFQNNDECYSTTGKPSTSKAIVGDNSSSSSTSSSSSSSTCQYTNHSCHLNSSFIVRPDNMTDDNLKHDEIINVDDVTMVNKQRHPDNYDTSNVSAIPSQHLPNETQLQHNHNQSNDENNFNHLTSMDTNQDYDEDTWVDCEDSYDIEEVCTCQDYSDEDGHGCSEDELPSRDVDLSGYTHLDSISEDILQEGGSAQTPRIYRKRKITETRSHCGNDGIDNGNGNSSSSSNSDSSGNGNTGGDLTPGNRKRLALESVVSSKLPCTPTTTPTTLTITSPSSAATSSSLSSIIVNNNLVLSEKRTPRSVIPTRENPPPELSDWLLQFQRWSHAERLLAVDRLIEHCEPTQVRHMMKVIEPQFQRDFISLLPKELALQVLSYLDPKDLLRAAQTCRSWRFLCDDNLLWKEKCKKTGIIIEPNTDRPKRGRAGNMPPISSPWKAAYMRQHIIEMNWRSRPIRSPKILKGHDDHVITCLQFCGNRIVSGSDDNTLKVWSAITGKCLRTLVGHTGGVWSSQMSGNIIISGSTDRTLKVWNADSGLCNHTLYGHTSTVRCMHLHGRKVVSGSRDATLRVWDIAQGKCLHILVGHLAAVRCVQYDGKLVVSGAYDYMVKVWNPERQECLHTLQGHTNRVYSLQFDGVHVVSGSLDTSIRVWDAETGSCKHTLMGHQSLTSGMELRQNILVSGNADSTVKVWDITSGQCLQTLSGPNKHQSAVTCLQFNSRFVVTSSDDGTVKLWDVRTGEFIRNLVALDSGGSGGVVWRIRANDTKLICAVGSRNGTEETKLMVLDFDVEGACLKCS